MKFARLFLFVFVLSVNSCGGESHHYYKCIFIADKSFTIDGEIFVNDDLSQKANFSRICVKMDSAADWEINGEKTSGNKFKITVDSTANGVTLSKDTINMNLEIDDFFSRFPKKFVYGTIIFYVDGRRAKGAIEPEFEEKYYFVYVPEAMDISGFDEEDWGYDYNYYYYNLNFSKPGWYKIYYSIDKPIGEKGTSSSGAGTIIRAPR